jgi:DHA1 family bicyclomycin/chloramphenicol resistance-like MFS transporter
VSDTAHRPQPLRRFWPVNVLLASIALMSSSIYLPALIHIAADLDTSIGMLQLTVTTFLLGNAISQLFAGMLSDRYGRRTVALWGVAVWSLSCLAAALVPNIESLLAVRVLQAMGGAAGLVVSRAVVRDLFDRQNSARAMALLMVANSIVPNLSPLLGGYIDLWLGWRWIFVFCAIVGAITWLLVRAVFPETSIIRRDTGGALRGMAHDFRQLATHRGFLAFGLTAFLLSWGNFALLVTGPALFIDRLGVAPQHYGYYVLIYCAGWVAGLLMSSRMTVRFGLERMIDFSLVIGVAASLGTLALALAGVQSATAFALAFAILSLGLAWTLPNTNAGAISVAPHIAGAAAGLVGFLQIGGGMAGTVTMFALPPGDPVTLAIVILASTIAASAAWLILRRAAYASG